MKKVVIAGSRSFTDYDLLRNTCDNYVAPGDTIISGTARGADRLGERYAEERGLFTLLMPAEWRRYGPAAGPIRNEKMAELADMVLVFWDGRSSGSKHMIKHSIELGKEVYVFNV